MSSVPLMNPDGFPLHALPNDVRKSLLETMDPVDVLQLSACSERAYDLCSPSDHRPLLDVTFTKERAVVSVRKHSHARSFDIIVGPDKTPSDDVFNCFFDKEYFFMCKTLRNGVVFPYGLDTILCRFFRLYPLSSIANLNICLLRNTADDAYLRLIALLEELCGRPGGVPLAHLKIIAASDEWTIDTLQPFLTIGRLLGRPIRYPRVMRLQSGRCFPVADYLNIGLEYVHINYSQLDDRVFNEIVTEWYNSSNTHFKGLTIGTTQTTCRQSLIVGLTFHALASLMDPFSFVIKRDSDGMMATVTRYSNKFVLTVGF